MGGTWRWVSVRQRGRHPLRLCRCAAAGAYQILYSTWAEAYRHGIVSDFTPVSQDKLAFDRLSSRGALSAVCDGNLVTAYTLLRNEWTALPGAKQTRMTIARAKIAFLSYGGVAK